MNDVAKVLKGFLKLVGLLFVLGIICTIAWFTSIPQKLYVLAYNHFTPPKVIDTFTCKEVKINVADNLTLFTESTPFLGYASIRTVPISKEIEIVNARGESASFHISSPYSVVSNENLEMNIAWGANPIGWEMSPNTYETSHSFGINSSALSFAELSALSVNTSKRGAWFQEGVSQARAFIGVSSRFLSEDDFNNLKNCGEFKSAVVSILAEDGSFKRDDNEPHVYFYLKQ